MEEKRRERREVNFKNAHLIEGFYPEYSTA